MGTNTGRYFAKWNDTLLVGEKTDSTGEKSSQYFTSIPKIVTDSGYIYYTLYKSNGATGYYKRSCTLKYINYRSFNYDKIILKKFIISKSVGSNQDSTKTQYNAATGNARSYTVYFVNNDGFSTSGYFVPSSTSSANVTVKKSYEEYETSDTLVIYNEVSYTVNIAEKIDDEDFTSTRTATVCTPNYLDIDAGAKSHMSFDGWYSTYESVVPTTFSKVRLITFGNSNSEWNDYSQGDNVGIKGVSWYDNQTVYAKYTHSKVKLNFAVDAANSNSFSSSLIITDDSDNISTNKLSKGDSDYEHSFNEGVKYTVEASEYSDDRLYKFSHWGTGSSNTDSESLIRRFEITIGNNSIARYVANYSLRNRTSVDLKWKYDEESDADAKNADNVLYGMSMSLSGEDILDSYCTDVAVELSINGTSIDANESYAAHYLYPESIKLIDASTSEEIANYILEGKSMSVSKSFDLSEYGEDHSEIVAIISFKRNFPTGGISVSATFEDSRMNVAGVISIHSDGESSAVIGGVNVVTSVGKQVAVLASTYPGFSFDGWYVTSNGVSSLVSKYANYAFIATKSTGLLARFSQSRNSCLNKWCGGEGLRKFRWASKVYSGSRLFNLSALRVYSDVYPVDVKVMQSSSPENVFSSSNIKSIRVLNQYPHRIPMMRSDKYFAIEISGTGRTSKAEASTSMVGLSTGA